MCCPLWLKTPQFLPEIELLLMIKLHPTRDSSPLMPLQPTHASEVEEHPKEDVSNDEPGVSAIGQGRRGHPSQETMAKAK